MKIALEIDGVRYEKQIDNEYQVVFALEKMLKDADFINDDDTLEVLDSQQRYVVDKSGY